MNDTERREAARLIDSYEVLVSKEQEARANGNQKHLAACLSEQRRVQRLLKRKLPA